MLDSLHPYACVLVVTALVLVKHCQLRNGSYSLLFQPHQNKTDSF